VFHAGRSSSLLLPARLYVSALARSIPETAVASDDTTHRSFDVLPAAAHLRRALGPSTWVVLESLLARSTGTTEESTVTISIRDLAADVAMSKDTVTRAVGHLHQVGLLDVAHSRTGAGTFGPTEYRLTVPADMFDLHRCADEAAVTVTRRPVRSSRLAAPDAQLSFTGF
jgi:hypothetical protein